MLRGVLRGAAARCDFAFGRKGWGRSFDFRVWVNVCELNCILFLVFLEVYYRNPQRTFVILLFKTPCLVAENRLKASVEG